MTPPSAYEADTSPASLGEEGQAASLPLQAAFHTVRGHPGRPEQGPSQNADEPVLSADPEGESGRGADRIAPPDAARRARPPDQRRHLCLAAARLSRA